MVIDNNFIFYKNCSLLNMQSSLLNMQSVNTQSGIIQEWEKVRHLVKCDINVPRSSGLIQSGWNLDECRQNIQPLFDPETNKPLGPGVWCVKFVSSGYLEKAVLISELLALNP